VQFLHRSLEPFELFGDFLQVPFVLAHTHHATNRCCGGLSSCVGQTPHEPIRHRGERRRLRKRKNTSWPKEASPSTFSPPTPQTLLCIVRLKIPAPIKTLLQTTNTHITNPKEPPIQPINRDGTSPTENKSPAFVRQNFSAQRQETRLFSTTKHNWVLIEGLETVAHTH